MPLRALRLAAVTLGIGLVMTVGVARAQDDEEDDKTFEEKIIDGIMAGIGATNMENRGIEYRERSPLVVPPKLDLPPPAATSSRDEGCRTGRRIPTRRAARPRSRPARKKKQATDELLVPLTPSELNVGRTVPDHRRGTATIPSATAALPTAIRSLSPSQLGFNGGLIEHVRRQQTRVGTVQG